jgi:hypothetical protein
MKAAPGKLDFPVAKSLFNPMDRGKNFRGPD